MIRNLTAPYVKTLRPQDKKYLVWDSTTKGFGVAVYPKGKISYLVQARVRGKLVRRTIGTIGGTPFKEARSIAEAALLDMRKDTDLLARVVEKSRQINAGATQITVVDLAAKFMDEYAALHCKPRSADQYRIALENHFLPRFGKRKINAITRNDVRKLHQELIETPYAANRMLAAVSKMYNQARIWELCEGLENPCQGIQKHPEEKRVRYLKPEELRCFHLALDDEEATAPMAVAAFRLLLYTGARSGEIQQLKWEYVSGNQLNLPDSKTGRKSILLSSKAQKVLKSIPKAQGNDYVIAGQNPGTYLINFKDPWKRVLKRATVYLLRDYSTDKIMKLVTGLESDLGRIPTLAECNRAAAKNNLRVPEGLMTLRIHDLRHNFASQMVMHGEGIAMVKEMLGHKRIETTARYAHLDTSAVQEAIERSSGAFDIDDDAKQAF